MRGCLHTKHENLFFMDKAHQHEINVSYEAAPFVKQMLMQYSAAGQLTVLAGAVIAVGDAIFQTEETTLSAANLDGASSFAHGIGVALYTDCKPFAPSSDAR